MFVYIQGDSKDDLFDLSSIGKSLNPEQDATPGASSRARETPPRSSRSSGPVMRARTTSSESGASAAESSPVVLKDQNLEAAASSPFSPPAAEPASPEGGESIDAGNNLRSCKYECLNYNDNNKCICIAIASSVAVGRGVSRGLN